MENQPVAPHEFVRLLTIVKVAEMLADRIKSSRESLERSPVVGNEVDCQEDRRIKNITNYVYLIGELGLIVRDHRPGIFDNYPVRLGTNTAAGRLLRHAIEEHAGFVPEKTQLAVREDFWQGAIMGRLVSSLVNGIRHQRGWDDAGIKSTCAQGDKGVVVKVMRDEDLPRAATGVAAELIMDQASLAKRLKGGDE